MAATARRTTVTAIQRRSTGGPATVELEVLAREAGLHPDLVRRLVRLGFLATVADSPAPVFPRDASARLARAMRLRRDLGLNYAGALLACELLGRIEQLEQRLRRYEHPPDRPR